MEDKENIPILTNKSTPIRIMDYQSNIEISGQSKGGIGYNCMGYYSLSGKIKNERSVWYMVGNPNILLYYSNAHWCIADKGAGVLMWKVNSVAQYPYHIKSQWKVSPPESADDIESVDPAPLSIVGLMKVHNMDQYTTVLLDNKLTIANVGKVTNTDLKNMGITKLMHRKLLICIFEEYMDANWALGTVSVRQALANDSGWRDISLIIKKIWYRDDTKLDIKCNASNEQLDGNWERIVIGDRVKYKNIKTGSIQTQYPIPACIKYDKRALVNIVKKLYPNMDATDLSNVDLYRLIQKDCNVREIKNCQDSPFCYIHPKNGNCVNKDDKTTVYNALLRHKDNLNCPTNLSGPVQSESACWLHATIVALFLTDMSFLDIIPSLMKPHINKNIYNPEQQNVYENNIIILRKFIFDSLANKNTELKIDMRDLFHETDYESKARGKKKMPLFSPIISTIFPDTVPIGKPTLSSREHVGNVSDMILLISEILYYIHLPVSINRPSWICNKCTKLNIQHAGRCVDCKNIRDELLIAEQYIIPIIPLHITESDTLNDYFRFKSHLSDLLETKIHQNIICFQIFTEKANNINSFPEIVHTDSGTFVLGSIIFANDRNYGETGHVISGILCNGTQLLYDNENNIKMKVHRWNPLHYNDDGLNFSTTSGGKYLFYWNVNKLRIQRSIKTVANQLLKKTKLSNIVDIAVLKHQTDAKYIKLSQDTVAEKNKHIIKDALRTGDLKIIVSDKSYDGKNQILNYNISGIYSPLSKVINGRGVWRQINIFPMSLELIFKFYGYGKYSNQIQENELSLNNIQLLDIDEMRGIFGSDGDKIYNLFRINIEYIKTEVKSRLEYVPSNKEWAENIFHRERMDSLGAFLSNHNLKILWQSLHDMGINTIEDLIDQSSTIQKSNIKFEMQQDKDTISDIVLKALGDVNVTEPLPDNNIIEDALKHGYITPLELQKDTKSDITEWILDNAYFDTEVANKYAKLFLEKGIDKVVMEQFVKKWDDMNDRLNTTEKEAVTALKKHEWDKGEVKTKEFKLLQEEIKEFMSDIEPNRTRLTKLIVEWKKKDNLLNKLKDMYLKRLQLEIYILITENTRYIYYMKKQKQWAIVSYLEMAPHIPIDETLTQAAEEAVDISDSLRKKLYYYNPGSNLYIVNSADDPIEINTEVTLEDVLLEYNLNKYIPNLIGNGKLDLNTMIRYKKILDTANSNDPPTRRNMHIDDQPITSTEVVNMFIDFYNISPKDITTLLEFIQNITIAIAIVKSKKSDKWTAFSMSSPHTDYIPFLWQGIDVADEDYSETSTQPSVLIMENRIEPYHIQNNIAVSEYPSDKEFRRLM